MKFITNINPQKFNDFVSTHSKNHFLQSYEWGVFKSKSPEWSFETVGMENDQGELVAAALVLIRFLPLIKRPFLYIPRGFVLDFTNESLLKEFTLGMKKFAKSKKAIFFKIDPDLKYVDRTTDGEITAGAVCNDALIQSLKKLNYKHLGFTQDFDSSIQPRYTFRLDLTPSEKELLQGCHSKTRYNLKIAQKKGIEIIEGTREDLKKFEEIMRVTGERDGFLTRPLTYFEDMYDTLAPHNMCKLYLAKLNTGQALASLKQDLEQTQATIAQLTAQLENTDLNEKKRQKTLNKLEPEKKQITKHCATIRRSRKALSKTSRWYYDVRNFKYLLWK